MKKYCEVSLKSYSAPSKPDEFITWLEDEIKKTGVPRKDIDIYIGTYPEYESDSAHIELSYKREETSEEKEARENAERYRADRKYQNFLFLKKEFEG